MKTKELIKMLQEADPTGEIECCVDNVPIIYVDQLPAYYDGRLQMFIRDEKGKIIGAKVVRTGQKVDLRTMSIEDAIFDNEDLPVDIEGSPDYAPIIEKYRKETREVCTSVELGTFLGWVEKFKELTPKVVETATKFFNENLSYKDPLPEDLQKIIYGKSFNEKREIQWGRELEISVLGDNIIIVRKQPATPLPDDQ